MSHLIKWDNMDDIPSIKIYRSTSRFTPANLPADARNLGGETTEYEYTDAVRGTLYYFMIEAIDTDGYSVFSPLFNSAYLPDTGPGPTKLIRGDCEMGYFGEVAAADVITFQEIWAQVVDNGKLPLIPAPSNTNLIYHKFILMGKIIYVPTVAFHNQIHFYVGSRSATYERYGWTTGWDINTGLLLSKGKYSFRWRMPKARVSDDVRATVTAWDYKSDDFLNSELSLIAGAGLIPGYLTAKANKDMFNNLGSVLGKDADITLPATVTSMNSSVGEVIDSQYNRMWSVSINTINGSNVIWSSAVQSGVAVVPIIVLEL